MLVSAGSAIFDVDAIVFDKDGTLIELDAMWFSVGAEWIRVASDGDAATAEELRQVLGLNEDGLDPNGVLAIGTLSEIESGGRSVLSSEREHLIQKATARALELAHRTEVSPIGSVKDSMTRMSAAGMTLCVASSDDHEMIAKHLHQLGINDLVAEIASGDGPYPPKPDPASLEHLSDRTGIAVERMLMVGDSINDVGVARNAGAAGVVVVAQPDDAIVSQADASVVSVDQISVN